MECKLCSCLQFRPNQWRKTLCQHCYHGASAHTADPRAGVPQWYYAKVEGPFTWEQMRHWYEAGYFDADKLLVKNADELGPHYVPLRTAFPREEDAFVPRGESAAVVKELDEDAARQVTPGEVKAKLPWMTKYFSRGKNWYFIDAQGEPQGPFPPENMANWFKAGYFWNKELMICHEGWESYVSLESIMQASDTLDLDSGSPSRESPVVAVEEPEEEAAPEAVDLHIEEAVPVEADEGVDSPSAADSQEWYYADETGASQGPFTAQQMREWFEWDYFGDATLVRHHSVAQFLPISQLFPTGTAFAGSQWRNHLA